MNKPAVAYFDCFSGISGDMTLGALLDAGADRAVLDAAVEALGLAGEVRVHARHEERGHLGGTRVVGSFWLLESLEVESVHASPLPAPRGRHSAPGTLRVLEGTGAVLEPDDRRAELVTPTGAAILATVARFERPAMALDRTGYGLGARPLPGNALGVWLGSAAAEPALVTVVEANLDDM